MELNDFLDQLNTAPENIEFADTISVIDLAYDYKPASFTNGEQHNEAGQNEGSCKIFAFANLNNLSETQTLQCFGKYYREDVLNNPQGEDHQNIRQFMRNGWAGVTYENQALKLRNSD